MGSNELGRDRPKRPRAPKPWDPPREWLEPVVRAKASWGKGREWTDELKEPRKKVLREVAAAREELQRKLDAWWGVERTDRPFDWLDALDLLEPHLSPLALRVALRIRAHFNTKDGYARPGVRRLTRPGEGVDESEGERTMVQRTIRELCDAGLIRVESGKSIGRGNKYYLTIPVKLVADLKAIRQGKKARTITGATPSEGVAQESHRSDAIDTGVSPGRHTGVAGASQGSVAGATQNTGTSNTPRSEPVHGNQERGNPSAPPHLRNIVLGDCEAKQIVAWFRGMGISSEQGKTMDLTVARQWCDRWNYEPGFRTRAGKCPGPSLETDPMGWMFLRIRLYRCNPRRAKSYTTSILHFLGWGMKTPLCRESPIDWGYSESILQAIWAQVKSESVSNGPQFQQRHPAS